MYMSDVYRKNENEEASEGKNLDRLNDSNILGTPTFALNSSALCNV